MPIELTFDFTFKDYLNAQRLHAKRSAWSRIMYYLWRTLFPFLGVLMFILGVSAIRSNGYTENSIFLVCWGLLLLAYPLLIRWNWKRCYRRTRMSSQNEQYHIVLDEDRVITDQSNCKSEFSWSAVKFYRENKVILLLYIAPAKFIPLPKRIINPDSLEQLHQLIHHSASISVE